MTTGTDDSDRPESHKKGERHERQAANILNRKYRAERVPSIYGNNDPFCLADVMGIQEGLPFAIIQVKTNRFRSKDRDYYKRWARGKVDGEHTIFELWVRFDRDGWAMHRLDTETEEFETYYETSTCNPSNVRDEWAAEFEQSLQLDSDQDTSD